MSEAIWDRFLTERDKAVFAAGGFGALLRRLILYAGLPTSAPDLRQVLFDAFHGSDFRP